MTDQPPPQQPCTCGNDDVQSARHGNGHLMWCASPAQRTCHAAEPVPVHGRVQGPYDIMLATLQAQLEQQNAVCVRLLRMFEPALSSRIPPIEEVLARAADLATVQAQLKEAQEQADRNGKELVNMQRHRDAWRGYAYGTHPKPQDFLDSNMVERPHTMQEMFVTPLVALQAGIKALEQEICEHQGQLTFAAASTTCREAKALANGERLGMGWVAGKLEALRRTGGQK